MTQVNQFIETVKAALASQRYSVRELAMNVGVDPSYMTRVLAGERNPPSDEVIEKIATFLNLNASWLLWQAGRLPLFLRTTGPLTDDDFDALKKAWGRIKQRHDEKKRKGAS